MGNGSLKIVFGFIVGATFACVADPVFPYAFYTLFSEDYKGALLGPTPPQDLPLEQCRPTPANKAPCTVLLTETFVALRDNDLRYQSDLNYCKRDLKNCRASCD